MNNEEHACFAMQGMDARADVLEPAALRDRVPASAEAVAARARRGCR